MQFGVGVIGVGVRGQHSYELALARHPHCALKAVSQYPDITPAMLEGQDPVAHARGYAQKHRADYHDDFGQLLAREDIHIISLMCEPKCAPGLVEACCLAGKHIVRDKPMCLDLEGADRIVESVEGSPSKLLVTLGTRFSPTLAAVKRQVADGAVGKLITATFTYLQSGGPLEGFKATPGYRESVGGGELTNFGHYAIDYLLWLMDAAPQTVYSTLTSRFYDDYQAVDMEDTGHLAMSFPDGHLGTVITGRTTTQCKPDSYFRLDISGTDGTIVCEGPDEHVRLSGDACRSVSVSPVAIDRMIAAFIQAVADDTPSPITARDGREVLRVLRAAYGSAREGRPLSPECGAAVGN